MAKLIPKTINLILAILLSQFVNHAKHVHRFFRVNVCRWTFFQRHCPHDSPVDVVFSHFPRCSVPLCLLFLFMCVVRRGVCVYVHVYVHVYVYV